MKNKKLLTRLFALLASFVLVLALALPCFADETEQPPTDYIYKRVYNLNELNDYFTGDYASFPCIVRVSADSDTYCYGELVVNAAIDTVYVNWTTAEASGNATYAIRITVSSGILHYSAGHYSFDGSNYIDEYDFTWDDLDLYIFVPASSTPLDPTTPSSDMYSNLFNILKDAVYGSDAELTGSQEYALTLISTILTYATILLPVILVIFIAVWCFKRF